jgi:N-acylmannosamine kinase
VTAALDIGGSETRAALVEDGRVRWRAAAATPAERRPEAVLDAALELLEPKQGRFTRLGVAVTGRVVAGRAYPLNERTLPGWRGFDLKEALEARTGLPIAVLNDARAAAYGEACYGAGRGISEFLFITVSTGVGAGLVLGGRLHLAASGLDAELGFTLLRASFDEVLTPLSAPSYRLPERAPLRPLELEASGTALDTYAQAYGWGGARELADRAEGGDARADAVYTRAAGAVTEKIADLAVLLGITRVALGGGVGLRPGYLARVRAALAALPEVYRPEIVPARLGADAGLIGAALYAEDTCS